MSRHSHSELRPRSVGTPAGHPHPPLHVEVLAAPLLDPGRIALPTHGTTRLHNRVEALGAGPRAAALTASNEAEFVRVAERVSGKHCGWNSEDVAARCGRPDHVDVLDGESAWYYEVSLENGGSEGYTFHFAGNLVSQVNLDAYS